MSDVNSVFDWLFNEFTYLWSIVIQYWVLSVPILLGIFVNLFLLIKGIYNNN